MLLLVSLLLCAVCGGHSGPQCDNKYEYVMQGGQMMGLITHEDPGGEVTLSVTIAFKSPSWQTGFGSIWMEEGINQMHSLRYYLQFPIRYPLPIVTSIKFNQEIICCTKVLPSGTNYVTSLTHTSHSTTRKEGRLTTRVVGHTIAVLEPMQGRNLEVRPACARKKTNGVRQPNATRRTSIPWKAPESPVTIKPVISNDNSIVAKWTASSGANQHDVQVLTRPRTTQRTTRRPLTTAAPLQRSWNNEQPLTRPATSTPLLTRPPTSTPLLMRRATSTPLLTRPATSTPPLTRPATSTRPTVVEEKKREICGMSVRPQPLMLGGSDVKKGDWPWVVTLHNAKFSALKCAGVLLGKRFVLMAAHCVIDPVQKTTVNVESLVVVIGKFDLSKWAETEVQPREVRRIILPPDFSADPVANDIAILYLEGEVEFTMYARPTCLLDNPENIDSLAGTVGSVLGWNPEDNLPRQALVPLLSQRECLAVAGQVADRTFCAGRNTISQDCIGDADSGLFIPKVGEVDGNFRWYLRGIPRARFLNDPGKCVRSGYMVYTDVAQYTPWIREVMRTTKPYSD